MLKSGQPQGHQRNQALAPGQRFGVLEGGQEVGRLADRRRGVVVEWCGFHRQSSCGGAASPIHGAATDGQRSIKLSFLLVGPGGTDRASAN